MVSFRVRKIIMSQLKTKKKRFKVRNMAGQSESRLMALPVELRNTIYEMTFSDHTHIICKHKKKDRQHVSKAPGLHLACKQTYTEAINIYYATAGFVLPISPERWNVFQNTGNVWELKRWADRIGSRRCKMVSRISGQAEVEWLRRMTDACGLNPMNELLVRLRKEVPSFSAGAFQVMVFGPADKVFWTTAGNDALKKYLKKYTGGRAGELGQEIEQAKELGRPAMDAGEWLLGAHSFS